MVAALHSDCGCEKPSRLAQVLAETIPLEPRTKELLDIGCGSGIIGLYCLLEQKAGSVTFIDVLDVWIEIARANVNLQIGSGAIAPSQVEIITAMPFNRISPETAAENDMLVFNLPQFPEGFVSAGDWSKLGADPVTVLPARRAISTMGWNEGVPALASNRQQLPADAGK